MKLYSYSPYTTPKIKEINVEEFEEHFKISHETYTETYGDLETLLKDTKYAKSPKEAVEKRIEIQKRIIKRDQEYLELALKDLKEVE